jgi:hypothetical protein
MMMDAKSAVINFFLAFQHHYSARAATQRTVSALEGKREEMWIGWCSMTCEKIQNAEK